MALTNYLSQANNNKNTSTRITQDEQDVPLSEMAFQLDHAYIDDNGVYRHNELQFFRVVNKRNARAVAPTRNGLHTCFSANQLIAKSGGLINLISTCKSCDDFANERNLKKKLNKNIKNL